MDNGVMGMGSFSAVLNLGLNGREMKEQPQMGRSNHNSTMGMLQLKVRGVYSSNTLF